MSIRKLSHRRKVPIKPKKLVDKDQVLTPEEEAIVRKGEKQFKKGKYVEWNKLKKEFNLTS